MRKTLALGLLFISVAAQATNYNVQLLQGLSPGAAGSSGSLAYGLNESGQVVGQSYNSATGKKEAVIWNNGVVASLGVEGLARAVNNAGTVVGETGGVLLGFPTGRAFTWSGSGPVTDIGDLGGLYAGAYDISENGVVTGFSCTNTNITCVFQSHGFRYDTNTTTMTDLGSISGAANSYSRGHGINEAGEIVGRSSVTSFTGSDKFMVHWDGSNNLTQGDASGIANYSTGQQINNNGISVGNGYAFGTTMRGMVWDENQNLLQVLGTFGGEDSRAWSINDLGVIVGFAQDGSNSNRAMVSYDGGATLVDLNTLALDLTGWASLDEAYDINENGDIVGIGTLTSGERAAFLLNATVVPLPAAAWLFLSGIGILAGFRRRRT